MYLHKYFMTHQILSRHRGQKKLSLSSIGNQDLDVSIEAANYGISMDEDITASFSSYAWRVEGLFF